MDFGISTCSYREETLTTRCLDAIHNSGFRHIELFANRPHLDYRDRSRRRELIDWFRAHPTGKPSLHLPFFESTGRGSRRWISALAPEERQRQEARDEIKRALEITDALQLSWVVVHLGVPGQPFSPLLFDYAYTVVDMIRSFAGVVILIENLPNEISTPERIMEFVRTAQIPEIRICYDIGHGRLAGSSPRLEDAGAVHLNDNDGHTDQHLWPFAGVIDWASFAGTLASSGFAHPLVFEGPDTNLEAARRAAARLEALAGEARSSREEFDRKYGLLTEKP